MNQGKKKTCHSKKFFQSSCQQFLKMRMSFDIIKLHSVTRPGLLPEHVQMFEVATNPITKFLSLGLV